MTLGPIAYVLWKFPKLSETFIVEEFLALERRGISPAIIACQRQEDSVEHPGVQALVDRALWIEELTRRARLAAVLATITRHPWRSLACAAVVARHPSRLALVDLGRALVVAHLVAKREIRYLHAHFADVAGEVAYFASRLAGVPFGVTVHGADLYVRQGTLRRVLGSAALRVTVCRYNVEQIVERCPGIAAGDVLVKYAGVDTARVRLEEPRPARPGKVIVGVGRLEEKKGFDVLVRAVGLLSLTHDPEVRCRIAGSGSEEEPLRKLIARLGLTERVELIGDISPGDVMELLAGADVLAAPCRIASWGDRDSMPVVLKEAMAMELPVVASDAFGIPELVEPGSGALVPPGEPEALAGALAAVLRSPPEERSAMGKLGRRIVEERFCEDMGAELLAGAIAGVLGEEP